MKGTRLCCSDRASSRRGAEAGPARMPARISRSSRACRAGYGLLLQGAEGRGRGGGGGGGGGAGRQARRCGPRGALLSVPAARALRLVERMDGRRCARLPIGPKPIGSFTCQQRAAGGETGEIGSKAGCLSAPPGNAPGLLPGPAAGVRAALPGAPRHGPYGSAGSRAPARAPECGTRGGAGPFERTPSLGCGSGLSTPPAGGSRFEGPWTRRCGPHAASIIETHAPFLAEERRAPAGRARTGRGRGGSAEAAPGAAGSGRSCTTCRRRAACS